MAKYSEITEILQSEILGGKLSGKLPSMRDLASRFQVSHITILRVFQELSERGLIYGESKKVNRIKEVCPVRNILLGVLRSPLEFNDTDNFSSEMCIGIQRAAQARHLNLFLAHQSASVLYSKAENAALLQLNAETRAIQPCICGVVVAASVTDPQLEEFILPLAGQNPVVVLNRKTSLPGVGTVLLPTEQACREVAKRALSTNCNSFILCQTALTTDHLDTHSDLVKSALLENGVRPDQISCFRDVLKRPEYDRELEQISESILRNPGKTMLFVSSSRGARFLENSLSARGLRAGKEFKLCCYDGKRCAYTPSPRIATIRISGYDLAACAVELLCSEEPFRSVVAPWHFDQNETM